MTADLLTAPAAKAGSTDNHEQFRVVHVDVTRRIRRRVNDGPGNGLGANGHRLREWFLTDAGTGHMGAVGHLEGVNREVMDELMGHWDWAARYSDGGA